MIRTLLEPSLHCADMVYDELHHIIDGIEIPVRSSPAPLFWLVQTIVITTQELNRFDNLRERIKEAVHSLLLECREPAKAMIVNLIEMEQAYINTSHPDFIGGEKAIQKLMQARVQLQIEAEEGHFASFNNQPYARNRNIAIKI